MMTKNRGLTVLELLISMTILSILIILGFKGFQSFQSRARLYNYIRTVISAMNTARYQAIEQNRSVKVILKGSTFFLQKKHTDNWETIKKFSVDEKAHVSMNASPVFSPTGYVVPLCSINIQNDNFNYKITISIAGRIKIQKI